MSDFANKPKVALLGGQVWTPDASTPTPETHADGQYKDYWVLPAEDRAKGFVRPVRDTYVHRSCGASTKMARAIAETFARDPTFYGRGFCMSCGAHFPNAEFTWAGTTEVVGS